MSQEYYTHTHTHRSSDKRSAGNTITKNVLRMYKRRENGDATLPKRRIMALTNGSVHHDKSDPIFNFLFEYYHFKPRTLLQWTPGFDTYLLDADPSLKGADQLRGSYFSELGVPCTSALVVGVDFTVDSEARSGWVCSDVISGRTAILSRDLM